jgi:hypothetical protein
MSATNTRVLRRYRTGAKTTAENFVMVARLNGVGVLRQDKVEHTGRHEDVEKETTATSSKQRPRRADTKQTAVMTEHEHQALS